MEVGTESAEQPTVGLKTQEEVKEYPMRASADSKIRIARAFGIDPSKVKISILEA